MTQDPKEEERYLYVVLNLTKDATQAEINDRHRSLSLIFHPDKQTDAQLKTVATKEFLEIQKAYQVLSDPFLRQVYDSLGAEGLKVQWPPAARSKSKEEIQDILEQEAIGIKDRKMRALLSPRGKVTCSLDASPLIGLSAGLPSLDRVYEEIRKVRTITKGFVFAAEKKISKSTAVIFEAESTFHERNASLCFLGTVRHQFSPRITTLATFHFTGPHLLKVETKYEDGNNLIEAKTALSLSDRGFLPTVTSSYSRRLFRNKPQRGRVSLNISKSPTISFFYVSPAVLRVEEHVESPKLGPPSISGFKYIAFDRSLGVTFDNILPKVVAEGAVHLIELSTRLRASLEYGLTGLFATLGCSWNNEKAEAGTLLVFSFEAIVWEINFSYLDVQLSLPIFLSSRFSPTLAFTTVVIPSMAIALGYHFFILPRRRARRIAHIRAARQAFEEDSDARKERNAVQSLLKDAVRKQIRIETEREGLVIQEATYGAAEADPSDPYVSLDVTTQLQAVVRNSQLHIPGGDSRASLQGFLDPVPFVPKSLRIRYLFRNRVHYAEIPDHLPVVLPLAEHEVL